MRTPWRFLADLVSSKPATDETVSQNSSAPETKAIAYQPDVEQPAEQPDAAVSEVTVEAESSDTTSSTTPSEASVATTPDEPVSDSPVVAVEIVGPDADRAERAQAAGEPATPHAARPIPSDDAAIAAKAAQKAAPPAAAKTPMDEMAELDAEIADLRRQLAQKLIEQNAQLKKMLARFDAR